MRDSPKDWESKELSEVVVLQRGFDLPVAARRAGSVAVLGSNGPVGSHTELPEDAPVPTVTVGRSGSVGKVCFCEAGAWPLNTTLFAKDYLGNDPKYIYHWLQHLDLGRYAQGVSVPTLNRNSFASIRVCVPPLFSQRTIAKVLDRCWEAVDAEQALEEKSAELKRAAMNQLFTRGLLAEGQKESEIGMVPGSWQLLTISDIALMTQYGLSVRGQSHGRSPILRMNCQENGRVVFRDLQYVDLDDATTAAFRLRNGDLLFNRTNSIEHVGRTAIFEGDEDAVFASYLIRLRVDESRCMPRFLNHYMNRREVQANIKRLASRAVGQANINATKLRTVVFPLPPTLDEQQEIVNVLDAIDRKIDLHSQKRAVLEELFKSLLHKLMTGEIRVDQLDLSALEHH